MTVETDRYVRQEALVPKDRLAAVGLVSVIGVGAIGRQVALGLAAIGVPRLQLIDSDAVDVTNVTTQGYFAADVGQPKVASTAAAIQQLDPAIAVETVQDRFRPRLQTGQAVFCCVDSISARSAIWRSVGPRCRFWADGRMQGEVIRVLAGMRVLLREPDFDWPERQDLDFAVVLAEKARAAAQALGAACLVDDAGLLLDAYPGFPGPLTGNVLRSLGAASLERLLAGTSDRGRMVCHIGCWIDGRLWHWQGESAGRLDPQRPTADGPGPLAQWFVPDEPGPDVWVLHRRRALEVLARELDALRRRLDADRPAPCNPQCAFCQKLEGSERSIYHQMLGRELPSRVVHSTEHFVVFPPLGEFIEGGLLLATRDHRMSMAVLPGAYYPELDRLPLLVPYFTARNTFARPTMSAARGSQASSAPATRRVCKRRRTNA